MFLLRWEKREPHDFVDECRKVGIGLIPTQTNIGMFEQFFNVIKTIYVVSALSYLCLYQLSD